MSENWNSISDRPIRVLWISNNCSLQDEKDNLGHTGRTERAVIEHCSDRIVLAVAYNADEAHERKLSETGVLYYSVAADMSVGSTEDDWEKARAELLQIIADFRPDIIQCFGAEWPYGAITGYIDIPVVIHMMGFLNIYLTSIDMVRRYTAKTENSDKPVRKPLLRMLRTDQREEQQVSRRPEEIWSETERKVMSSNRYFMGRTEWDRNIVRYYSPGSKYYHVEEAVKQPVYDAAGQWHYHNNDKLRLFTLSSADERKGNEIILRTAGILKEVIGIDFEWRVAGHKEFFPMFEQNTGIRRETVNVKLLGMIGSDQIIDELKSADFFIHPSIIDNSPHSICEAQLIGCPVIASNVGGVPDLVENGVTGFLYPYNEPHTLAFIISNCLKEEALLKRISANEVKTAMVRHDPETISHTLADTYADIIRDYRGVINV